MKLFAPRNDWNMTSPAGQNWFNMAGSYPTASGLRIDESTALTNTSVMSATRIISETLASLPCNIKSQINARTTQNAIDHPLYNLLHDQPNPEQDIMCWLDSQVAFQVLWGNAYAEIQRNSVGDIVALWPIHPSRIPLRNIIRNGTSPDDYDGIETGLPGELVYNVLNDDGSRTQIPASDMLHVPGILSTNGITGQSIIKWGANAIGNAIAADTHAGMMFKNGAVTQMAIKSPKVVGPESAALLRASWQATFGGLQNSYKTLLLEDGMEPVPINMNPEVSQLLETRRFTPNDIARLFRLPPHLLGDMSQASYANIESEGLSFVVYSMIPWISRWEKALQRQLLTDKEKSQYRFKFNVNGLLRGDSAARAQFYQTMFNLGAYSPNDIRGLEDENPVEGGDQYFVQGNNCVPLDKIGELVQANIDKAKAPPPQPQQQNVAHPQQPIEDSEDPNAKASHLRELRAQMERMIQSLPGETARSVEPMIRHELAPLLTASDRVIQSIDNVQVKFDEYASSISASYEPLIIQFDAFTSAIQNIKGYESAAEERARSANAKTRDGIRVAIMAEAEQLMRYETRIAKDAARKPKEFPEWRASFYPNFTAKMSSAIGLFVDAAEAVGFTFDADAIAGAYAAESIASLEVADEQPMSEFEGCVEAAIDAWAGRPKQLSESLFKGTVGL